MRILDDLEPEFLRLDLPIALPSPAEVEIGVIDDRLHELMGDKDAHIGVLDLHSAGVILDSDEFFYIGVIHPHGKHECSAPACLRDGIRALAEQVHKRRCAR